MALAKHPAVEGIDTSAVRWCSRAPRPRTRQLATAVADRLACVVAQGYGMTETSPVTHVIDWRDPGIDRSSIGRPVPGTEARVVSPDGSDVIVPDDGPSRADCGSSCR